MATPDTKHSIVITKRFSYRGSTRDWSNRYHFEGALPVDHAAWQTLADNIVTAEKAVLTGDTTIVQAQGYDAGTASSTNPHGDNVFTATYSTVGTLTLGSGATDSPGDAAVLVRYGTTARSTKNHPVYLMNYYHGCWQSTSDGDEVAAGQVTAMETYADHWLSGFTDGTGPRERCGPRGAVAISRTVNNMVHHRDFPN